MDEQIHEINSKKEIQSEISSDVSEGPLTSPPEPETLTDWENFIRSSDDERALKFIRLCIDSGDLGMKSEIIEDSSIIMTLKT